MAYLPRFLRRPFQSGLRAGSGHPLFRAVRPKARKYSSHKLSAFAVDVMLDATGLAFRPGMRDYLVDFIAWAIRTNSGTLDPTTTTSFREFIDVDGLGFSGFLMSLNLRFPEAPKPEFRSLFEEDSWNAWVAFIHANLTDNGKPLSGALVASANLGDTLASTTKKKRAGDARPQWSIDQEKALRKLIDEARKQEPPPRICHTAWSSIRRGTPGTSTCGCTSTCRARTASARRSV